MQSSVYYGVHFLAAKEQRTWRAYHRIHGHTKHLGVYDSEREAVLAVNEVYKEHGLEEPNNIKVKNTERGGRKSFREDTIRT